MKNLTIRVKLTLWYVVMIALMIGIFVPYVYLSMSNLMYNKEVNYIKMNSAQALSSIDMENNNVKFTMPSEVISSGTFVYIFNNKNKIISGSATRAEIISSKPSYNKIITIYVDESKWIIFDKPIYNENKIIAWIRCARSLKPVYEALDNLVMVITFAIPIYIIIAILGGLFISGRALHPIDKITKTAREIGQGNLSKRLNLPNAKDEVGRLALTFDEMISRLEASFLRERKFAADASHELRTPITVISAYAEEVLAGVKTPEEYREALNIILNENRNMGQMVSQLLMLTRSDDGKYKLDIEEVNLNVIVHDVIEEMQNKANISNTRLEFTSSKGLKIMADQMLLTRTFILAKTCSNISTCRIEFSIRLILFNSGVLSFIIAANNSCASL